MSRTFWNSNPSESSLLKSVSVTNLKPGCYVVSFTTPAGYTPTTADSGSSGNRPKATAPRTASRTRGLRGKSQAT